MAPSQVANPPHSSESARPGAPARNDSRAFVPPAWVHDLTGPWPGAGLLQRTTIDARIGPVLLGTVKGEHATLAGLCLPGAGHLSAPDLVAGAQHAVRAVLQALRDGAERHTHVARMWSFVPGIHGTPPGAGGGAQGGAHKEDRYQLFNRGRYQAFVDWFGSPRVFARDLPSATCVGGDGAADAPGDLWVYALGTAQHGVPVDNPSQVPAFEYSRAYGERPPCFARATLATFGASERLLVAGTASIKGERSTHPGDLDAQLAQTIENLAIVLRAGAQASARHDHRLHWSVSSARVYAAREADMPRLFARVPGALERLGLSEGGTIEWQRAKVCREDLLVEIEVVAEPAETPGAEG
jgi:chorismate lyase/3-hydroxybenzoate synthase